MLTQRGLNDAPWSNDSIINISNVFQYNNSLKNIQSTPFEQLFLCTNGGFVAVELACNGVPDCQDGSDEAVIICGCLSIEFQCGNNCVNIIHRCDTALDCPDGEDEGNCETFTCSDNKFKCNNHFCIANEDVCDFEDHCGDNSDELDCLHRECWKGEFRCRNGQCIRPGQLCDGVLHCKDGSDEVTCNEDDFATCSSGKKIHRFFWCDGWPDCRDNHADELNCRSCLQNEFQCSNSRCIRLSRVCDAVCDCAGSCDDEKNCTSDEGIANYRIIDGLSLCNIRESLQCKLGNSDQSSYDRCVHRGFICDGTQDTSFGEVPCDEDGCGSSKCSYEDWGAGKDYFMCSDGRCLPGNVRCDHQIDCLMAEDEVDCEFRNCSSSEWECSNGQCVEKASRCDLRIDCKDKSDELSCTPTMCPPGKKHCISGSCLKEELWCDWISDCPDGSDEQNCDHPSVCGKEGFKCSSGQCIDIKFRCFSSGGKREGCADESHLINCKNASCKSTEHKCKSGVCINGSLVCNQRIDCPDTWDDEDFCPFQCSNSAPSCECRDVSISCQDEGMNRFPQDIEPQISRFFFRGNYLNSSLTAESFVRYSHAIIFDLSNNSLRVLPRGIFSTLPRLRVLDLRWNLLTSLKNSTFFGLAILKTLDLSKQKIKHISKLAFVGLRNLHDLNLSHNKIEILVDGAFSGLTNILSLNLQHNVLLIIGSKTFSALNNLKSLYTDGYRFCCLARHVPECFPPADEFSSCEDLMSNVLLRFSIWVLGTLAFIANLLVIVWRLLHRSANEVHSFLLLNLAIGDMLMGVYLLIIAGVDLRYRGVYFIYDATWRASALCKASGFLSTFSSELSVFTLTVITLERLAAIIFPFKFSRLTIPKSRAIMVTVWLIAGFLSALPLSNINYFRNFYARSGVCLALHITHEKPHGWEYSVFIFLALNLLSFTLITASYLLMYVEAKRSSMAVRTSQERRESNMARRMSLIVATDAACWLPIIFLEIVSLCGYKIPPQVFAWVAVLILPLNSAINPLLYTFSTTPYLGRIQERISDVRNSIKRSSLGRTLSSNIGNSIDSHNHFQSVTFHPSEGLAAGMGGSFREPPCKRQGGRLFQAEISSHKASAIVSISFKDAEKGHQLTRTHSLLRRISVKAKSPKDDRKGATDGVEKPYEFLTLQRRRENLSSTEIIPLKDLCTTNEFKDISHFENSNRNILYD